jgi:hypothetical protein
VHWITFRAKKLNAKTFKTSSELQALKFGQWVKALEKQPVRNPKPQTRFHLEIWFEVNQSLGKAARRKAVTQTGFLMTSLDFTTYWFQDFALNAFSIGSATDITYFFILLVLLGFLEVILKSIPDFQKAALATSERKRLRCELENSILNSISRNSINKQTEAKLQGNYSQ